MDNLSRKEKEFIQRKNYIIKAATELFAEKGYDNTTIDEIAARAEFSKGSVYKYFESKDKIFEAIFTEVINIMTDMFAEIIPQKLPAVEKLKKITKLTFEYAFTHKYLVKILLSKEGEIHKSKHKVETNLEKKLEHKYSDLIKEGITNGEISKGDALTLDILFDGIIIKGLLHMTLSNASYEEYVKTADTINEVFFHGCC